VKTEAEEIIVPKVKIIAFEGNEPPASEQYQNAIAALYGIGYTLKMGLKYSKLPQPEGYFDYKVGGLETLWWSRSGEIEIQNAKTLQWKAFLMVPSYVTGELIKLAKKQANQKKPNIPYDSVTFETLEEGHALQILHIGPYDQEKSSIDKLKNYCTENNFKFTGHHHEIYISDPRRAAPEKLKTVIRYPVKKNRN
jgi:hypothetical protein